MKRVTSWLRSCLRERRSISNSGGVISKEPVSRRGVPKRSITSSIWLGVK